MGVYISKNNVARKVTSLYVGDASGKARKVKSLYVGVAQASAPQSGQTFAYSGAVMIYPAEGVARKVTL